MFRIDFSDSFLIIFGACIFTALLLTKKFPKIKKPVLWVSTVSYLFIILTLTLQPLFISSYKITWDEIKLYGMPWNIKPFSLIIPQWKNILAGQRGAYRQFFGNIVMFIPVGILMPFIFRKTKKALWMLLGGFLFTLCIESLQLLLCLIGMCIREFDVDDLILNTLGAMIGYIIHWFIFIPHRKKTTDSLE